MASIRSAVGLRRVLKFAAILLLAPGAADAASFVKGVGFRTRSASTLSNSSMTVSPPSSGVAAGDSIIVTVQVASLGGAIACSDNVNGAYNTDVVSPAGVGAGIAIASKHNVAALGFGDVITCSYPSFNGASSMSVYEFTGLEFPSTLDRTAQSGSSASGAASSGLTATTVQATELVFGFVWLPGATQTFSPATSGSNPLESPYAPGWSPLVAVGTQKPMYRFVTSVRQYEANGTVGGDGGWLAQVATYRAVPDLCATVDCNDGSPCTDDSCNPATGLCSHSPRPAGTACGDLSSGICDAPDVCDSAGVCQANHVADGTACGEVDSDCENADTCLAGACHDNGVKPAGTLCGDSSSGQCDNADSCDGAGSCSANPVASGTSCDDAEACTDADACDGSGLCAGARDELCFACIGNTGPIVSATVVAIPVEPVALASGLVSVTATFADAPGQAWTCTIDWGDGSAPDSGVVTAPSETEAGNCTGSHLYTAVGVYAIAISLTDMCGESAGALYQYAVVYDPDGGFVTGAGWINSPEGAYAPNPALTGKAHFGFVSAYTKGNATTPSGRTDFHFSVASFDFTSITYDWLVVSGAKARFRGTGQVNGAGSYGFALTALDGEAPGGGGVDKFRIKIWDQNQGDAVVYDNQVACPNQGDNADPCTALEAGAIVIHKK